MNVKTLFIFILAITFLFSCSGSKAQVENKNSKTENDIPSENKDSKTERAEEKAVRIAEEFIKRNGYTDFPADKNNLSHETVEFFDNIDELLKLRHDSLEPTAYGFIREGKSDKKGWTIIFRYNKSKIPTDHYNSGGRAVTMNEKFENLLVEHKDIGLKYAEVKLEK